MNAEQARVADAVGLDRGLVDGNPWHRWGPYLSERAWGTVREDYSAGGDAWSYLPHDAARSQAFRWSEDGLAGVSDVEQRLCLALALWNGRDPILKERAFGLTGPEGNHGEDVKEYFWYLDALPSHAWLRWRYHYPQGAFPYEDLVSVNGRRTRTDPEYELLDTGVFDEDRYWVVEVTYAKAGPNDVLMRVAIENCGPDTSVLHVLPTLWLRNTWSWDGRPKPGVLSATADSAIDIQESHLGRYQFQAAPASDGSTPTLLFCDNETNTQRLYGVPGPAYSKDGINDAVVMQRPTVNPDRTGTKAAVHYTLSVPPGGRVEMHLRLAPAGTDATTPDWREHVVETLGTRAAEADAFYADLAPAGTTPEEQQVMRQAFAGMIWGKQFYHYDIARWLDGDPAQPAPPVQRRTGRNAGWRHFDAYDIMSMPDPWEYPWFAAWDLAFHTIPLAHLDPGFAKYQLLLLCREWFQDPSGAIPAYEWNFDDVNPPIQAWAALQVFLIDGSRDKAFLERMYPKLLMNYTWWLNREDPDGNDVFAGGFLGLDNICPVDRSHLPPGVALMQSDGTSWMAFYALTMLAITATLAADNPAYRDLVVKHLEDFARIAQAMNTSGLWDADDGFYYDLLRYPDGRTEPLRVRSLVGLIPLLPGAVIDIKDARVSAVLGKAFAAMLSRALPGIAGRVLGTDAARQLMVSVVDTDRLRRVLRDVFDEESFLSPHGLRSVSKRLSEPYRIEVNGQVATVEYDPAESRSGMFGGNSNWRGPIWFPLNFLLIQALERYGRASELTLEYPTGSGLERPLNDIADDLRRRLVSLWLTDEQGRRPVYGGVERLQSDPRWRSNLLFFEYFHGDNGAGLGAMHQTGWTGLVADLIVRRGSPTTLDTGQIDVAATSLLRPDAAAGR